jgi:IclR family mhp operon transcriptional activator
MSYKRIRSLERGVAVLQFINQMGFATAGNIAKEIGLPRPTVYRILDTLVENGLIYRSPSAHKVYRLTEAVGRLSGSFDKSDPLSQAASAVLGAAPDSLPWPIFLTTLSDEGVMIRETTRGSTVFWTEYGWVGAIAPIWNVAPGRIMVAFSPPDRQQALLQDAPPGAAEDIQTIFGRGYAEEHDKNGRLSALAVPLGEGDTLIGALAMTWEPGGDPDDNIRQRYLPVLRELRDQILERLP